jgi:hypothetical protein
MHGGEEKCIRCSGGHILRQEAMWSSVEEDFFPILVPRVFLFKTQHYAEKGSPIGSGSGVEISKWWVTEV